MTTLQPRLAQDSSVQLIVRRCHHRKHPTTGTESFEGACKWWGYPCASSWQGKGHGGNGQNRLWWEDAEDVEWRSTYQPIEKDPTLSLERKMNAQLMGLKRSGQLFDDLYMQLRSLAGRVPLLYELSKVHKQAVALWPIVSFVTSPTYQLSKFLNGVLAPVVGQTSSYVKNSKAFAEFIATQALTKKEILVSFDVVSLFTCIPTYLAVQVARRRLEDDPSIPGRMDLSVNDIVGLLTLCLNATFLSFRG